MRLPQSFTLNVEIAALNPTAGDGLLGFLVPSGSVCRVDSVQVTNMDNDTGEMLECGCFGITTPGSLAGASSPTPQAVKPSVDATSGVTTYAGGNAGLTTEPTTWGRELDRQGWNNQGGYFYDPRCNERIDDRPTVPAGEYFFVRLLAAPSAAFKASVSITYTEETTAP